MGPWDEWALGTSPPTTSWVRPTHVTESVPMNLELKNERVCNSRLWSNNNIKILHKWNNCCSTAWKTMFMHKYNKWCMNWRWRTYTKKYQKLMCRTHEWHVLARFKELSLQKNWNKNKCLLKSMHWSEYKGYNQKMSSMHYNKYIGVNLDRRQQCLECCNQRKTTKWSYHLWGIYKSRGRSTHFARYLV